MRRTLLIGAALVLLLGGCRNETQNQLRRQLQEFTSATMYVTLYSLDGTVIYEGDVDGKVTRASATVANSNEAASGSYIYWFDKRGVYHQSDLPYLVTSSPQGQSEAPSPTPETPAPESGSESTPGD